MDGVDVSGHWSTFIESRVVTDYNEALQDEIAAFFTKPSMSAVFTWTISRPWARRSPRSSPEMSNVRRITSYNVCYTKLLR